MSQPFDPSNERLQRATAEMRAMSISQAAMDRGETAILAKAQTRPPGVLGRLSLICAAGLTAAAGVTLFLLPSQSLAGEISHIVKNGEALTGHCSEAEVHNGIATVTCDYYTDGSHTRVDYSDGSHFYIANGREAHVFPSGATVLATMHARRTPFQIPYAADLVLMETKGKGTKIVVERGVEWQHRKVDRYTIDGSFIDGQNRLLANHTILFADPTSKLPIQEEYDVTGYPRGIITWDYAPIDPKSLLLPESAGKNLFDLDAERGEVEAALANPSEAQTIEGQKVGLVQLWVDTWGSAYAIVATNLQIPDCWGVKINGESVDPTRDSQPPPFGRWNTHSPTLYKGDSFQIYRSARMYEGRHDAKTYAYPDHVRLSLPVFKNQKLLGYAEFKDVPVHRCYQAQLLLEPSNIPFFAPDGLPSHRLKPLVRP